MYYKPYLKTETEEHLPSETKIPEEIPPQAPIERISIRNGQKIKIIPLQDILYLQAEGDYVAIITGEGKCLKEQTMKYFEENLPKDRFIRIHRSYIVAVNAITRIEKDKQQQQVMLINKERIKISSTGYRILKERLGL